MIRFECDYNEGMHPQILKRLIETNDEQQPGYMLDEHCEKAREYIKKACNQPDSDVHFIVGGTQANLIVITAILRPHQGVISASSGHINTHESGSIEATGHKVLALPSEDGTISAAQVQEYMEHSLHDPTREHTVQPAMVYISFPTENGTLYTKQELTDLYAVCKKYELPLFIDGARLGYGLQSAANDLTLEEFAHLCDVFYIGGTKVGAMMGEAVVFNDTKLSKDFRYLIKQRGALLAKGRFVGIQFETLFENGLYMEIAKNAMTCAEVIRKALQDKGYEFLFEPETNQLFPIMPNDKLAQLQKNFAFSVMDAVDEDHTIVRICTSWATKMENVEKLINEL